MMIKKKFFIETKWVRKNILANILDFPYFVQSTSYTCGVACVLGILWYYGDRKRREMLLEKKLEVDEDEWAEIENIVQFFKKENFKVDSRKMTLRDLEKYLDRWIPIIVLYQARSKKKIDYIKTSHEGHYAVVIGYNKDYLFLADPVIHATVYITKEDFMIRWHQEDGDGTENIQHGIAVYGKKPIYNHLLLKEAE